MYNYRMSNATDVNPKVAIATLTLQKGRVKKRLADWLAEGWLRQ